MNMKFDIEILKLKMQKIIEGFEEHDIYGYMEGHIRYV